MSLFISIAAIIIALAALLIPFIDKDFRRSYFFSKKIKHLRSYTHNYERYSYHNMALSWMGSAYHFKPELVNMATHTLGEFYYEQSMIKEAVFYVSLKDYKMVSEGTYKLLLEDPYGEAWSHFVKLERSFIERNLDRILRIEAEVLPKETIKGIIAFDNDSSHKLIINPIKVEETGIPTQVLEVNL